MKKIKIMNDFLELVGIASLTTLFWQGLEMIATGSINTNITDTIVGLVLSYSLFYNLKCWEKNKQ